MTLHLVTATLSGGGTYTPHAGLRKQTSAGITADLLAPGVTDRVGTPRTTSAGVTPDLFTGGVQDFAHNRYECAVLNPDTLSSGVQGMAPAQHPYDTIGVAQTAITLVTYYKKRARDSAGPTPTSYVTWVTTNVNAAYPDPLPYGGPLVEEIIAEYWQV